MKKLRQFDPLVIEELVKDQFHQPSHGQTYYEIVYIFAGRGQHRLNNGVTPYEAHDCFFITPEDTHYLEIQETTHFGVIKFTDSYFNERKVTDTQPILIMRSKALRESKLQLEHDHLYRIVRILMDNKDRKAAAFIFYQILSLFALIQEHWERQHMPLNLQQEKQLLISFIHQHIYEPDKIQIKFLAQTFNISPNYFGRYFKANVGIGFREYIDNYRIKLIENRVQAGFTLRQIADEFGFTDDSHLSHYFKKKQAVSFREYRRKS